MNRQISIIGCGWLGLPLAKHLMEANYHIKGSTTSLDKIEFLKSVGVDAFYVELTQEGIKGDIENSLVESEILILNIPPGLRKHAEKDFVKHISDLILHIENSSIKNVVFISSTSVYADGLSIPTITEDIIPNPNSESGRQLLEVEALLQKNTNFSTTILRFGGLYGADRHPAKYLSGKTKLKNPNAPVNLIHLDDCIEIIQSLIENAMWNEVFNASTTPHPTRKEYYPSVCKSLNLPLPQFDHTSTSKGKVIDSTKLKQLLNYRFRVKLNN